MKVYIIAVMVVAVIGSIISAIAPEGEGGGLKNHVKLAIGIAILPICLMPMISFVNAVRDFDAGILFDEVSDEKREEYESIFEDGYLLAESENLREGIAAMLGEKFDIGRDECYVSVSISENDLGERCLTRIYIELYGGAVWKNTGEIEKYLSDIFSCEVVSAIG